MELTREQISLLNEEKNKDLNTGRTFRSLQSDADTLISAKVSEDEASAHRSYLEQLNQESKGKSLWYRRIVEGNQSV